MTGKVPGVPGPVVRASVITKKLIMSSPFTTTIFTAILAFCLGTHTALAQNNANNTDPVVVSEASVPEIGFERYHKRNEFLMASPGAMRFGLYGYDNPAMLQYIHDLDFALHWTSEDFVGETSRFGAFFGAPGSSFSFVRNDLFGQEYRDYRIGLGGGTDAASAGLAINWYRGDTDLLDLSTNVTFGTLFRPGSRLSVGLTATTTFDTEYSEAVADVALRPFGSPFVTVFGDFAIDQDFRNFQDGRWSAGAAFELMPGLRFTGRYIDDVGITAGIQFSLGRTGVSYQSHMDTDGNHSYNSYGIRAGALDRNIFESYFRKDRNYVNIDVSGSLPYQTFQFFDDRTTYLKTLDQVHEAANDPSVSGVIVNTKRMSLDHARSWELRKALVDLRQSGKKVIMYVERGGMNTFHLASAADYVVMDPMGGFSIPGFVMGTTYIADLLESAGIGVDEFREMDYKSAFEALSRTEMSEADREQRERLLDGFYDLVRSDVTSGRNITPEEFDALIDGGITLSPRDLVDAGIVDTLARDTELSDIIEEFEGRRQDRISPDQLYAYNKPRDDQWGPINKIAVLYAEGPTMNETGIRARKLSSAIRNARNDRSVKAVVLRADSPGGDALASDLVAEELRKTSGKKPVIVSMGAVAASGGYWISMYADTIVAAPNTITGSIGVIGGWLWDDGMSGHLRLHTDHVKRGKSADLGFGPTLPLIGLSLPNRPLADEERETLVGRMTGLYDEFIDKVADGRDADFDEIKEVAAGRVWTGSDARDRQLVDELGSLYTAIQIAVEKAGLQPTDKIEFLEGPDVLPFSLGLLLRGVFGSDTPQIEKRDPVREYLELMIENNAQPLVIMPFEYFSWIHYLNPAQ